MFDAEKSIAEATEEFKRVVDYESVFQSWGVFQAALGWMNSQSLSTPQKRSQLPLARTHRSWTMASAFASRHAIVAVRLIRRPTRWRHELSATPEPIG